mmetsp:Transcript_22542/g.67646  ORF Transcript_22542/g.67646 Transcript_22542/m.67646 type:complete len:245 (-) Transcript_22542:107-841(-)
MHPAVLSVSLSGELHRLLAARAHHEKVARRRGRQPIGFEELLQRGRQLVEASAALGPAPPLAGLARLAVLRQVLGQVGRQGLDAVLADRKVRFGVGWQRHCHGRLVQHRVLVDLPRLQRRRRRRHHHRPAAQAARRQRCRAPAGRRDGVVRARQRPQPHGAGVVAGRTVGGAGARAPGDPGRGPPRRGGGLAQPQIPADVADVLPRPRRRLFRRERAPRCRHRARARGRLGRHGLAVPRVRGDP